jgi:hypothetical protein
MALIFMDDKMHALWVGAVSWLTSNVDATTNINLTLAIDYLS